MLDIKFIRQNPDKVKEGCKAKQVKVDIDGLLEVDRKRREILQKTEEIRAQKNGASKQISETKNEEEKQKIILKMRELDVKGDKLNKNLKILDREFGDLMHQIPNLPLDEVPAGKDERDNVVLREMGERPKFDFEAKNYLEIAQRFDLIDVKRAAKIAGTRFGFLKREAALLEFALINFALNSLMKEDFIPIIPPIMMKSEMMRGMGYLEQTDIEEAYYLPKDDLFLAATAEQPIGTMMAGEIFEEKDLPKRYLGFSTCFRREAGAYGKDTRGIFRVHQFDKIEMFSYSKPDQSKRVHQCFLKMEEKLMRSVKIPYRVVQIGTGDLGLPAATT